MPRAAPQKPSAAAASALRGVYLVPQRNAARAADARLKSAAASAAGRSADDTDAAEGDRTGSAHAARLGAQQGRKPRGRPPKSRLSAGAAAAVGGTGASAAQRGATASKQPSALGSKAGVRPKGKAAVRLKVSLEHGLFCSRSRPIADVLSEQKVGQVRLSCGCAVHHRNASKLRFTSRG